MTILHGQGVQQKKTLKAQHSDLVDKKAALKSALIAARGMDTKFDQIASFWEEFVLEPEERELQQQRRQRKAKATTTRWGGK